VIIYTSVTNMKVIRDACSLGGDALLSKPPKAEDLLDLIQHFPDKWERPTALPPLSSSTHICPSA
jgi:hypothetical protein